MGQGTALQAKFLENDTFLLAPSLSLFVSLTFGRWGKMEALVWRDGILLQEIIPEVVADEENHALLLDPDLVCNEAP